MQVCLSKPGFGDVISHIISILAITLDIGNFYVAQRLGEDHLMGPKATGNSQSRSVNYA